MPEGGFNVEGCTAVVTGAASGIGREIAIALGGRGARVVLADVDTDGLGEAERAVEAAGGEAMSRPTDVADEGSWADLAEATAAAFGPAQLLVNNAGVMTRADLDESDRDDWAWILGVNLHGVVEGVRTFLPQLRQHAPNAHIMNTGSMAGLAPRLDGNLGAYSASKAAVVVYSEVLRQELAAEGIGVSVLCPGTVATGIFDAERNRPADFGAGHRAPVPERVAQAMTPDRVAQAVLAAIEANEPFIFTHEDSRDRIEARFERIAASLDAAEARRGGGG
jgi:NAD(P)-dependent dehydrogenase (short-subunit alcohol dehydrogenase family)